jgi:soluble P-type ATPase
MAETTEETGKKTKGNTSQRWHKEMKQTLLDELNTRFETAISVGEIVTEDRAIEDFQAFDTDGTITLIQVEVARRSGNVTGAIYTKRLMLAKKS